MKLSHRLKKSVRIAAPVLIALLLSIAILPGAALAQPSDTPDQVPEPNGAPGGTPGGTQETPSGDPPTETPPVTPPETTPPETTPPETTPPETTPPETTPPATTPPATTPPATTPPATTPPATTRSRMLVLPSRPRLIASWPMPLHRRNCAPSAAASSTISSAPAVLSLARGSSPSAIWPRSMLVSSRSTAAPIPLPASRFRSTTCLPTRRFGSAPSTPITSTTPTSPTTSPSMPTTRCPMKPGSNKAHIRLLHETRS